MKLGVDPVRYVLFDLVDRATGVDDGGRRYLVRGCDEGAVEIDPRLEERTFPQSAHVCCGGMFAGEACALDVWRAGQAEEVRRVEVVEDVAVREDLSGQHDREVHDRDVVLGEFVTESHHRPPKGRIVLVRQDNADEVLGEDVSVEKDRAADGSREPSTERGFPDPGGAGHDQQRRFDERALVGAVRAAQHFADWGNQVGESAASADLTRERHTTIMSQRRPRMQPRRHSGVCNDAAACVRPCRTIW